MIDRMPTLMGSLPELRTYLLQYPKATLPNSTDFLYRQEAQFGLKPTIRISHLIIQERANETVVASQMLYASHYFWTALRCEATRSVRGRAFRSSWSIALDQMG